jgi:hypothetical protein
MVLCDLILPGYRAPLLAPLYTVPFTTPVSLRHSTSLAPQCFPTPEQQKPSYPLVASSGSIVDKILRQTAFRPQG